MRPTEVEVCECGDQKHMHDETGCRVCKNGAAPWDGCRKFVSAGMAPVDSVYQLPPEYWRVTLKEPTHD